MLYEYEASNTHNGIKYVAIYSKEEEQCNRSLTRPMFRRFFIFYKSNLLYTQYQIHIYCLIKILSYQLRSENPFMYK